MAATNLNLKMETIKNITITDTEQTQHLAVAGSNYTILVSGEQTNGNYAVIDMLVPPGSGPGPHSHAAMQEMFYVLEGEVEFKMEGRKITATKGSLVNIPLGGAVHCFKNTSVETARLLCTVVPAGLDDLFREIGQPVTAGIFLPAPVMDAAQLERLKVLAEKYGQQFYPPAFLD